MGAVNPLKSSILKLVHQPSYSSPELGDHYMAAKESEPADV